MAASKWELVSIWAGNVRAGSRNLDIVVKMEMGLTHGKRRRKRLKLQHRRFKN